MASPLVHLHRARAPIRPTRSRSTMSRIRLVVVAVLWGTGTLLLAGDVPTDRVIEFLTPRVERDPDDFISWNKLAERYVDLLRETGNIEFLPRARAAATQSLKAFPPDQNPGGLAARGRVEMAEHRFAAAGETAGQLRELMPGKSLPCQMLGDALLELGQYPEAERAWHEMVEIEGSSVNTEPRLARLDLIHGRIDKARERFTTTLEIARTLTPAQPSVVAWTFVQLGALAFQCGDWELAEKHYQAALEAIPDGWAALDHLAELRGAQGRIEEARALYEKLITRVSRPELQQALGDLLAFGGREEEARAWHDKAEKTYLAAGVAGEVLYFHHLAGFYADSRSEPAKAVTWARKDLELRQSIHAHDALAWALYKKGETAEAVAASDRALATDVRDSHLLYHAGMIRMSAGDIARGKALLKEAAAVNPRFNTFHAHR